VVTERVHFWSALAAEEQRPVAIAVSPAPVPVRVGRHDLSPAWMPCWATCSRIRRRAPAAVRLTRRPGGGAQLVVADDGPGLPDLPVLQRGNSGTGSSGLGLDIVRRTARAAGGQVTVGRSETGGAHVLVEFGPPPHPPAPARARPPRRTGTRHRIGS